MSLLLQLCIEFFKIGLFSIGGGLATIPFLNELIGKYHWYTLETLTNMIAISEATPGAVGINIATYVGYHCTNSIIGGIITTLSLVAPSLITICIIAHFLEKFKNSEIVNAIFYGLRAAVCALIVLSAITIFKAAFFKSDIINLTQAFLPFHFIIFIIYLIVVYKFKKIHPIAIILSGALIGIILQL